MSLYNIYNNFIHFSCLFDKDDFRFRPPMSIDKYHKKTVAT